MAAHETIGLHIGAFYLRLRPLQLSQRVPFKPVGPKLDPRDLKILKFLAESDGQIVTRDELFRNFFMNDFDEGALNTVIWKLRQVLGKDAIELKRDVGYSLTLPVRAHLNSDLDPSMVDEMVAGHLKHTSYFALPNPPDILEDEEAIQVLLHHPSGEMRFAPPIQEQVMAIIDDILASDEKIPREHPDYKRWRSHYEAVARKGYRPETPDREPFAAADSIPPLAGKRTEVIRSFLDDWENGLNQAKEDQLRAYLRSNATKNDIKRLGNAFGFNGRQFTLCGLSFNQEGDTPGTRVAVELRYSDYFTYRIIASRADAIYNQYGLNRLLLPGNTLWEYAKDEFQELVHCGFGIGVMVHTVKDNKLIITVRSDDQSAGFTDAGKLAESANESLNTWDLGQDEIRPIKEIVRRAVNEELFSKAEFRHGGDLSEGGKEALWDVKEHCWLLGALVYFPNLSCNLLFMLSLDCYAEQVRQAWGRSPQGRFSAKAILPDHELPDCSPDGIAEFITKHLNNDPETGETSTDQWDEGSLVPLLLCSHVPQIKPL